MNNEEETEDELKQYIWYHDNITTTHSDLNRLLKHDGEFLVRKSTHQPGEYTVSLYNKNKIENYRIEIKLLLNQISKKYDKYYYLFNNDKIIFNKISKLIDYYMNLNNFKLIKKPINKNIDKPVQSRINKPNSNINTSNNNNSNILLTTDLVVSLKKRNILLSASSESNLLDDQSSNNVINNAPIDDQMINKRLIPRGKYLSAN